uniref:Uncharacterized protein n=1 Tax=Anguilla anguilla TaxID=7936 RepID=A0A0E9W026_ANGAN
MREKQTIHSAFNKLLRTWAIFLQCLSEPSSNEHLS